MQFIHLRAVSLSHLTHPTPLSGSENVVSSSLCLAELTRKLVVSSMKPSTSGRSS